MLLSMCGSTSERLNWWKIAAGQGSVIAMVYLATYLKDASAARALRKQVGTPVGD